ncbi:hypothetical protein HX776_24620 [Pseudomonas agarici]|uniref:hypothetical protein n=1 Tax=Pseudomonas agarici TaxID=46677 RepID=UPI0008AE63A4|nr:hypothetical protein [Pseudomonas agarici]NWC11974.1 hypothetical protein [Pseudomonas agarici]SEL89474.1 hypothetical protein SAMN05216604_1481 [Pseudomonas agarici]SEL90178.1 hypothetical protein SAMN05216604_14919 [Pseudomonas agarici]
MHSSIDAGNTLNNLAPRFSQSENVAHERNYHISAAMHAVRMVRFQYTKEAKNQFRRECLDHLRASLSGGAA